MKSVKSSLNRFIPSYALVPVTIFVTMYIVTYYFSRVINAYIPHHNITTVLDGMIPFIPSFIVIYILSYIQWFFGFLFICRESKEVCYEILSAEIIAKFISFVIFVVFPTTMLRAEIMGNDIFSQLTKLIYDIDKPNNLLPSLHCLESWMLFRTAYKLKKPGKWLKPTWFVFAVLVFVSVVCVKQHVIVDIPAAIIVSELGIWLARKFNAGNVFEKINAKILKKGKVPLG